MRTFIIANRILKQLQGDKRYLVLSIIAPLIIIYFLQLLFNAFPPFVARSFISQNLYFWTSPLQLLIHI